ncbi:Subtilisin-like protease SBT4.15 [Linum perenne]
MEKQMRALGIWGTVVALLVFCRPSSLVNCSSTVDDPERKSYIVYMGSVPEEETNNPLLAARRHHVLLSSLLGDEELAREVKLTSYGKSFDGFAAKLLPNEAHKLRGNPSVVSVFPDTKRKLTTTRTWDFLGMTLDVNRNIPVETDIIVGMLDTGIYMDAPAFNDDGFGPPPKKWKGSCQPGANFTGCNKKVIGARAYDANSKGPPQPRPPLTPLDMEGHGTHTASTVAGVPVRGASLYGIGEGTARGGVPSARLAIYKVCAIGGQCYDSDILSGFDDAVKDGVDIISISIGRGTDDYFQDSIAIGSFHAIEHDILTCAAAGNDGKLIGSVSNVAPWMLTVGATGSAKQYKTMVGLGNGLNYSGISINTFSPTKKMYPLTSGMLAQNESYPFPDGYNCEAESLNPDKVNGSIVICGSSIDLDGEEIIKNKGGVGLIISQQVLEIDAKPHIIPTSLVAHESANSIFHYINVTKTPKAVIYRTETMTVDDAPFVAEFSSRGPNVISRTVLKPDLGAPGVNVLASYSKIAAVTDAPSDDRHQLYNIMSGTSMSAPHVAAAAVYVKSFHPTWSPAAIKSALMTTASRIKVEDAMAEYAYGAGQIDPLKAIHPGLVYDSVSPKDYISFLCNEGYTESMLRKVARHDVVCPPHVTLRGHDVLNYPSMNLQVNYSTQLLNKSNHSVEFHRMVTNVGPAGNATYTAVVTEPEGIHVSVMPTALKFMSKYEKKSFKVVVTITKLKKIGDGVVLSGALGWKDTAGHVVTTPIVVSSAMELE